MTIAIHHKHHLYSEIEKTRGRGSPSVLDSQPWTWLKLEERETTRIESLGQIVSKASHRVCQCTMKRTANWRAHHNGKLTVRWAFGDAGAKKKEVQQLCAVRLLAKLFKSLEVRGLTSKMKADKTGGFFAHCGEKPYDTPQTRPGPSLPTLRSSQ